MQLGCCHCIKYQSLIRHLQEKHQTKVTNEQITDIFSSLEGVFNKHPGEVTECDLEQIYNAGQKVEGFKVQSDAIKCLTDDCCLYFPTTKSFKQHHTKVHGTLPETYSTGHCIQ
jgi:hypothetical protein